MALAPDSPRIPRQALLGTGILLLLLLLQSAVVPRVFGADPDYPRPDLLLVFVLYVGVFRGGEAGATSGFWVGLLQDALSVGLFGKSAFAKCVAGFAVGGLSSSLFVEALAAQAAIAAGATLLHNVALLTLGAVFEHQGVFRLAVLAQFFVEPVLNGLLAAVLGFFFRAVGFLREP
ncbi:MAG: rod shape-determining protein MreD [Candidatus Schekmanbacteria bacterium]|nr:rod shape-determining protein MreD [Candidatus Schekmanbacteria bacterium]